MKNYFKLGAAVLGGATLSLAAPVTLNSLEAKAATAETPLPNKLLLTQPEQILREALSDNFLSLEEAKKISSAVAPEKRKIKAENAVLQDYKNELQQYRDQAKNASEGVKYKQNLLTANETRLAQLNTNSTVALLEKILALRQEFAEKVLIYYPYVKEKGSKRAYSVETELYPEVQKEFLRIADKTNKLLNDFCRDKQISPLIRDEPIRLMEVLAYAEITSKVDKKMISQCSANLKKENKKISKEVEDLKQIENDSKAQITILEAKIKEIDPKPRAFEGETGFLIIKNYVDLNSEIQKYLQSGKKNYREYFSVNILTWRGSSLVVTSYGEISMDPQKKLEKFLKEKYGKNVKFEKLKNPSRTKLPLWLTFTFGIFFPTIRNIIVNQVLRPKESDNEASAEKSTVAGFINSLGGIFILDSLHPLVYPARLFATPFIIQPLRKVLRGDKDFF